MSIKTRLRWSSYQRLVRPTLALLALAVVTGGAAADTPGAAPAAAQSALTDAQWQSRSLHFDFMGFTSRYSCYGLEDKVRMILATFGARKDMDVRAYGCPEGPDRPSRIVSVDAKFQALAPLGAPAAAGMPPSNTVKAQWVKVALQPRQPDSMGEGECELVEQMQNLLEKGFVMRDTAYHTACTPHEINVGDYSVTAEVLKPVTP